MQQAYDGLKSYAQIEHSVTYPSTRSIVSRLAIGLSATHHHPSKYEHNFSSYAQTKHGFAHLRSGFTLVELIVTISILAIIALIAAPSFATMYSRQKLESSARELVMKISEARSQAVLLRESTGVCLASLSEDDCATAIAIPKKETQRIFIARLDNGVTSTNASSTNLSFRRNGSLAAQKDFILQRQNLSYCIQVGVIGDTIIKEGACP